MVNLGAVTLLVDDPSVLAALEFALSIEGFEIWPTGEKDSNLAPGGALVVDERYLGDGLLSVERLRDRGWNAPAIILSTNPSNRLRSRAAAVDAILVEKPLLGDELSGAIRSAIETGGH